jgi:hypothetical protein
MASLHLPWSCHGPLVNIPHLDSQLNCSANCLQDNSSAWTVQKTQPLCCYTGVFTTPLHSNCHGTDHTENTVLLLLCACSGITQHWLLFRELLLSNGSIHYIVPSLRLFDFFFSEGCACDICDRSHPPSCGLVCMVFTLQLLLLLPPKGRLS